MYLPNRSAMPQLDVLKSLTIWVIPTNYRYDAVGNRAECVINLPCAAAIPYTTDVSTTGAVIYNVPVEVYSGIHGFQPQIFIVKFKLSHFFQSIRLLYPH
jgi:hypothetical protein